MELVITIDLSLPQYSGTSAPQCVAACLRNLADEIENRDVGFTAAPVGQRIAGGRDGSFAYLVDR